MCGIVAYSGQDDLVIPVLLAGIKRLEYRGYDSAGLSLFSQKGIYCKKATGKVAALEAAIDRDKPENPKKIGIAHTRWATHGPATEKNAHPHASQDGKIWLVHNGIIENYQTLKDQLSKKGYKFASETDSEVIAQLISSFYKDDLRSAVLQAAAVLTGAFSICVISLGEPDRLIGVKMSSPLVLGVAENNELIIASDVAAIIERTKKVIYLEDGELIDVQNGGYEVLDFKNQPLQKSLAQIEWDLEAATKSGYDHYLLKEIMEQPQAALDCTRGRLVPATGDIKFGGLIDVDSRLQAIDRVILLGVGTSYYAAKMGELYFNALAGVPAAAAMAPEFRYTKNHLDENTWVIALSQSGETADTIAAITEARHHHPLVTGIVNVIGSTIARITDAGVYNHIGPEISVASTKAFTAQSLLVLMHAIALGRQNNLDFNAAKTIISAIEALPKQLEKLLETRTEIEKVAKQIYQNQSLFYLGRQYNYPIALEGALKMKELTYLHAEGLSAGELKHGFIALIDNNLPTIAIATSESVHQKMLVSIEEIKARGGPIIALANQPLKTADMNIIVPASSSEFIQPILNNVALQLLAYYVAKFKGLNIDQPRNLAKSVTVE
ncbi:MAG: glutamine--fructose-6-phosphate transaminase (isomerizing) [Candidatus Saccharimonadales bacterium]